MENTTNLKLPLLIPNQSQKEITHNEALIIIDNILQNGVVDKDLSVSPENPETNDLYIVGNSAIGDWAGKEKSLAFFDNGWRFIEPREGFTFWINDENCLYSFDGNSWVKSSVGEGGSTSIGATSLNELSDVLLISLQLNDVLQYDGSKFINKQLQISGGGEVGASSDFGTITNPTEFDIIQHNGTDFANSKNIQNISMLGIGTTADENNKLSVKSDYVLFDKEIDSSRVKVNKASETDTSSHLFQSNYNGRAEFGLIGNDDFTLKVSEDGNTWNNAFVVDKATGNVDFKGKITKNGVMIGGSTSSGSGNVWISEEYPIVINVPTIATHNLNLENPLTAKGDIILKCVENDGDYLAGDFGINCGANTYAFNVNNALPIIPSLTQNKIQINSPNDCIYVSNKNNGNRISINVAKWKYIFRIFY